MIEYTTGNLLDADAEALVNTVNTVGVMGKGIALMFKERFPANMKAYADACKRKQVNTGEMFITDTGELMGPRWIVNFPTKQHWRSASKMEWIDAGLQDLRRFIKDNHVKSVAVPPLGAGNGGLSWEEVKPRIIASLGDLDDVRVIVFEPTATYRNVSKRKGVEKLTPARALVTELVRRYWLLGIDCSLLEIQKLAWFLQRAIHLKGLDDPLQLHFDAHNYGPYANNLDHLLNGLDGSYLKADKRIPDANPLDVIWFRDEKRDKVQAYLNSEAKEYLPALALASDMIDGFESPYGMELLATVDWLLNREGVAPDVASMRIALKQWPAGKRWAERKDGLFDDQSLKIAIDKLVNYQ